MIEAPRSPASWTNQMAQGGWVAQGHPIISVGGRALCARATEGEILASDTKEGKSRPEGGSPDVSGGADRDRTDDLLNAIQALSQLSYGPTGRLVVANGTGVCQSTDHPPGDR